MRRAKVLWSSLGGLTLAAICLAGPALADEKASSDDLENAFARLKTLVGTWEVEEASVRGEAYEDTRTVVYELSGKGSALVEHFYGESSMASVYHMNGAELRLTHYCSAGNQPRGLEVRFRGRYESIEPHRVPHTTARDRLSG
jgi:hypothetical protein